MWKRRRRLTRTRTIWVLDVFITICVRLPRIHDDVIAEKRLCVVRSETLNRPLFLRAAVVSRPTWAGNGDAYYDNIKHV